VNYINSHLNGVQGHPIKLITCIIDGTPAASQKCAQQFVATKGLTYVYYGLNEASNASDPILEAAHIFVSGVPLYPADYADPDAAWITGGLAGSLSANAEYIADTMGAKKIGVVVADNAEGLQVVDIVTKVAKKYGATVVPELPPATTTDLTGYFESLATAHVNVILDATPGPQAISFMQAYAQQGSNIPVVVTDGVFNAAAMQTLGNAMKGVYLGSLLQDPSGNTPDAQLFRASTNNNQAALASGVQEWSDFMTVYQEALEKVPYAQLNTKTIIAALSKPGLHATLGPPFQCGLPSPLPAVCSFGVYMSVNSGPPNFSEQPINGTFPFVDSRSLIDAGIGS
jgi:branched-chain amino acid transport system substrate-binding protein